MKIFLFFYSDYWHHFVNMFMMQTMIVLGFVFFGITIPLWTQFLIPIVFGIVWEMIGKKQRNIEIDYKDIGWTVFGGYVAILFLSI